MRPPLPLRGLLGAPAVLAISSPIGAQPFERALVVAWHRNSAAVLAAMVCEVTALECSPELAARARELGLRIAEGPLAAGHKPGAPYHLILIDGAVEHVPEAIVKQLADGGRLGAALSQGGLHGGVARLIIGQKVSGAFGHLSIGDAGVASLPGFARPATFQFERYSVFSKLVLGSLAVARFWRELPRQTRCAKRWS